MERLIKSYRKLGYVLSYGQYDGGPEGFYYVETTWYNDVMSKWGSCPIDINWHFIGPRSSIEKNLLFVKENYNEI